MSVKRRTPMSEQANLALTWAFYDIYKHHLYKNILTIISFHIDCGNCRLVADINDLEHS